MKKGFFQDGNGNDSIMRLLAFISKVAQKIAENNDKPKN